MLIPQELQLSRMLLFPYFQPLLPIRSSRHFITSYHIFQTTTDNVAKISVILYQQQLYHNFISYFFPICSKSIITFLPHCPKTLFEAEKEKIRYTLLQYSLLPPFRHEPRQHGIHSSIPIRNQMLRLSDCVL